MCGRTYIDALFYREVMSLNFKTVRKKLEPNFNLAPTQDIPVMTFGSRVLDAFRWGFIPHWAKDDKIGYSMINARAESLLEKQAFHHAFLNKRCVVLVSGFFEWKDKVPYVIKLKDNAFIAFAGIYSHWQNPKGETLITCSIITSEPNEFMKPYHNRMPVILQENEIDFWIHPDNKATDMLMNLLRVRDHKLEAYEVRKEVGSVKNNSPENIKPLSKQNTLV